MGASTVWPAGSVTRFSSGGYSGDAPRTTDLPGRGIRPGAQTQAEILRVRALRSAVEFLRLPRVRGISAGLIVDRLQVERLPRNSANVNDRGATRARNPADVNDRGAARAQATRVSGGCLRNVAFHLGPTYVSFAFRLICVFNNREIGQVDFAFSASSLNFS